MLNLKFGGHFFHAHTIHIGHGHESSLGNQATQVFRVPLAHLPHSQYSDTQLTHSFVPLGLTRRIAPLHDRQYKRLANIVQVLPGDLLPGALYWQRFTNDSIALQICLRAE